MAYIGKQPVIGNFVKLDAISVVNGQAAYTMNNGGSAFTNYDNVNQFLVSLNGILQAPTDSFTVSGSTLTFASNLATGDVIDFVIVLGNTLDIGTPSDNTVSLAKLTATGTKDATTFLRGDNTFAEVPAGGITEADMFRLTADFLSNADPISSNLERVDDASFSKIGTGMSVSSGIFTFPTTGLYHVIFHLDGRANATTWETRISATINNSTYDLIAQAHNGSSDDRGINTITSSFVNVTNTSNVKVKFHTNGMNGADTTAYGNTDVNRTFFKFIRLGDSQ
jgi:hypothetical protein